MKRNLSAFNLKLFTVMLMCFGTIMGNVAVRLLTGAGEQTESAWSLYYVGYAIYQMSFPLSAFLLVEGACHTTDKKRFLKRLLLAALIAELPLDLVANGVEGFREWGKEQNYFFTLAFGLFVILLVERLAERFPSGGFSYNLVTLFIYLAAAFAAGLLHLEQGGVGILVILALYLFRGNKFWSLLSVLALYVLFMGSYGSMWVLPPFALLFTWLYNGERGPHSAKMRLCFYAIYPVVSCLCAGIALLI